MLREATAMQSNYAAALLLAASYALWLTVISVELPLYRPNLLLVLLLSWALVIAAIGVWHSWKVIFTLPQFFHMFMVLTLIANHKYCTPFPACVP